LMDSTRYTGHGEEGPGVRGPGGRRGEPTLPHCPTLRPTPPPPPLKHTEALPWTAARGHMVAPSHPMPRGRGGGAHTFLPHHFLHRVRHADDGFLGRGGWSPMSRATEPTKPSECGHHRIHHGSMRTGHCCPRIPPPPPPCSDAAAATVANRLVCGCTHRFVVHQQRLHAQNLCRLVLGLQHELDIGPNGLDAVLQGEQARAGTHTHPRWAAKSSHPRTGP
jgi:hypothetical protein